ncbi:fibrinogen C domain-containing protein 1-like [Musca autumnalis]|uniref:fibrinogen C domain-containing protein 1-like n=1 Tax=Musca autumnalis TaxID=221902 RepID=UPI003CE7AADE
MDIYENNQVPVMEKLELLEINNAPKTTINSNGENSLANEEVGEMIEPPTILENNRNDPTPTINSHETDIKFNETDCSPHFSPVIYVTDIHKEREPKECNFFNGSHIICSNTSQCATKNNNTFSCDPDYSKLTPLYLSPTAYVTDMRSEDEPVVCKLYNGSKLICSKLLLPDSCANSIPFNCRGKQCRIRKESYGEKSFWVACDDDWIVIQRRINGTISFERNWEDYKNGFGDLNGEFWLGLEKIHALTAPKGSTELKIEMQDFDNTWGYSHYKYFFVDDEHAKYELSIQNYVKTNLGDSLDVWLHSAARFSTYDQDNDRNDNKHCASLFMGGWWHWQCNLRNTSDFSNLNGFYYKTGLVPNGKHGSGITWSTFRGLNESLKYVQMKIRCLK